MTAKEREAPLIRALVADAANPDAWERVGSVGASTSPRPAWYGKKPAASRHDGPSQPDVDRSLRDAEASRRKQLHDAIAVLPEGQRGAIQLWLDGFDYTAIAHALETTVAAVKSRVREARRHLPPTIDADITAEGRSS